LGTIYTVSVSDLILAIVILAGAAVVVWILELNPYSKQFQVYTQTCDNMILDNTHCKGAWHDNPVQSYAIHQSEKLIIANSNNQLEATTYESCEIQDSKNWTCENETTQENISVEDGLIIYAENSDTRQISRLQWLQNRFLEWLQ